MDPFAHIDLDRASGRLDAARSGRARRARRLEAVTGVGDLLAARPSQAKAMARSEVEGGAPPRPPSETDVPGGRCVQRTS
jgi:hypothetical protein